MELKEKNNVWLFLWRFNQGKYNIKPNGLCSLFWGGLLGGLLFILSAPFTLIAWGIAKFKGKVYFEDPVFNPGPIGILNFSYTFLLFINYLVGYGILREEYGFSINTSYIFGMLVLPILMAVLLLIILTPVLIYNKSKEIKNENISVLTKGVSIIWDKVCPRIEWKK